MIRVFDASALIAYLRAEPGGEIVNDVITHPTSVCFAHAINLCEVYYDAVRVGGVAMAEGSLRDLFDLGIIERADFDSEFWKEVALLKAEFHASLADFCGVVLTNRLRGVFLTADHKDFDELPTERICRIKFIR